MPRHFLLFGKILRLLVVAVRFPNIVREQAAADPFQKMFFPPWPAREPDVEGVLLSAPQPFDDFLDRIRKTERARNIVCRSEW